MAKYYAIGSRISHVAYSNKQTNEQADARTKTSKQSKNTLSSNHIEQTTKPHVKAEPRLRMTLCLPLDLATACMHPAFVELQNVVLMDDMES